MRESVDLPAGEGVWLQAAAWNLVDDARWQWIGKSQDGRPVLFWIIAMGTDGDRAVVGTLGHPDHDHWLCSYWRDRDAGGPSAVIWTETSFHAARIRIADKDWWWRERAE